MFRFAQHDSLIGDNSDRIAVLIYGSPCGDQGFQVRDLQVACRFNASHFTTSTHFNEIFYRFSQPLHFCRFDASLSTASGQLAPAGRFPEPLEKYEMIPPARIYRLESSPRMISPHAAFISYQVNVDANGNNIVGDAANEPSISVDPTDGNKMAIGWRQFDTITSNFREAGVGYTTDAGITWHFPGPLDNGVFRSDPVTNSDETGRFFYLSLLVNNFCGDIWRSINGGQNWTDLHRQWSRAQRRQGMVHRRSDAYQHGARFPVSVLD